MHLLHNGQSELGLGASMGEEKGSDVVCHCCHMGACRTTLMTNASVSLTTISLRYSESIQLLCTYSSVKI